MAVFIDGPASPKLPIRPSKENYYLDIAEAVLGRGTCIRRNYGAIIVKDDRIVSTGYTGAPRGEENCCDTGKCLRKELNVPSGEKYELCKSVHAEMNAIINASALDMQGATLYLVGKVVGEDGKMHELVDGALPCKLCRRQIINAGIKYVIIRNADGITYKKFETHELPN